ncbi:MAG: hypothetical protein ABIQ02_07235 [Saprospiraceae bacterium]
MIDFMVCGINMIKCSYECKGKRRIMQQKAESRGQRAEGQLMRRLMFIGWRIRLRKCRIAEKKYIAERQSGRAYIEE